MGQKFFLWIGIALVSAVSFGAGLIVGAGRGIDAPFPGTTNEEIPSPEGFDALGPPLAPEGVIQLGDRGTVPSKTDDGRAVSQTKKSGADREKASAPPKKEEASAAKLVKAPSAKPTLADEAPARKPAKKPAPKVVAAAEPEPRVAPPPPEPVPEPKAAPSDMTFYETSTDESDVPGLSGRDEEVEDAEAPPEPAPEADPAVAAGADVLARRRLEQTENALPAPDARVEDKETPTGADLLARRQSGNTETASTAPAATPGTSNDTYTVQVTTLADESEARRLMARLKAKGFDVRIVPLSRSGLGTLYRIRVGRYPSEASARSDLNRLVAEPGAHPYIRME
jgi:cell division septation protein DedD